MASENHDKRATSGFLAFWTSLPGILTGAAATIGAVAALLALFVGDDSPDNGRPEPAQPPPPALGPAGNEEPFLKRRPGIVQPGTLMTLSGGGFSPGERVVIEFKTKELGAATANTSGRFNGKRVRFPRDEEFAGSFSIRASGERSLVSVNRPIEVRCKDGYRQRLSSCFAPGTPGFDGP